MLGRAPRLKNLNTTMGISNVLLSAALVISVSSSVGGEADPARAVSSGRDDVVYLAAATEPYEALPLGNGQLGVMVRNSAGMNYIFNHGSFFANAEQDNDLISSGELALEPRKLTLLGRPDALDSTYDPQALTVRLKSTQQSGLVDVLDLEW